MIRQIALLGLAIVSTSVATAPLAAQAAQAAQPAPKAEAVKPVEKGESITIVIKQLITPDGSIIIKPEGGGKALTLNQASNTKAFTAAKMEKLMAAAAEKTPIKLLVRGSEVIDILD